MRRDLLAAMQAEAATRRPCALATDLASGAQLLFRAADAPQDALGAAAIEALRAGRSAIRRIGNRDIFFTVSTPAPRLVLIGAVHVAQALAPMARLAGLDVTIIDPRSAFADAARFPDTRLVIQWPQDALKAEPLDEYCAVALLTHDPRIDDPALFAALAAGCRYIGALGSHRTHAARCERLAAAGRVEAASRIHAPIGLDIGAETPAEIAVAILAEVVATMRGRAVMR